MGGWVGGRAADDRNLLPAPSRRAAAALLVPLRLLQRPGEVQAASLRLLGPRLVVPAATGAVRLDEGRRGGGQVRPAVRAGPARRPSLSEASHGQSRFPPDPPADSPANIAPIRDDPIHRKAAGCVFRYVQPRVRARARARARARTAVVITRKAKGGAD
jgi:hypothetical protein